MQFGKASLTKQWNDLQQLYEGVYRMRLVKMASVDRNVGRKVSDLQAVSGPHPVIHEGSTDVSVAVDHAYILSCTTSR